MTKTLSLIGVILFLTLCAACWWMATGAVDNVQTMGQADYLQMRCEYMPKDPDCMAMKRDIQKVAGN